MMLWLVFSQVLNQTRNKLQGARCKIWGCPTKVDIESIDTLFNWHYWEHRWPLFTCFLSAKLTAFKQSSTKNKQTVVAYQIFQYLYIRGGYLKCKRHEFNSFA